jgi:transcriptional regulator with PAS, ATPase and Fis domain
LAKNILYSWIGGRDLDALIKPDELGPVYHTLKAQTFDRVELLYNYSDERVPSYLAWLKEQFNCEFHAHFVELSSPTHFGEIYHAVTTHLAAMPKGYERHILLSPGTPAMQSIWILLGKTRYPATCWEASKEQGVSQAHIPFEIAAEYTPSADDLDDETLSRLAITEAPESAAFKDIITQNPHMQALKQQATLLAGRNVPVLIYGESGTGKELFARAMHNASPRAGKAFVPLNCGAIPPELIDSTLFGHVKGAFTGASSDKSGVFEQADGGTLFLDEFGELEPAVQVRLLRVLQDGSFTPVGGKGEKRVDIRLITATNKNLMQEVAEGRFRDDLFYRVAVGVLHLPPLRERQGDLSLLADASLAALVKEDVSLGGKKISIEARNVILSHAWPGNMRELKSTLMRAALWAAGDEISAADIRQALFQMPEKQRGLLARDISQGVDIKGLIDELVQHYIPRALAEAGGKKSRAAELLGLKTHQTLSDWIKKHNVP